MASPSAPTFEHHRQALGIGGSAPRISWKTQAEPAWRQVAYELLVVRDGGETAAARVESSESVLVRWPFLPLRSRERAEVCVRVVGADGGTSSWSPAAAVEAGLLDPADWLAAP